MSHYPAGAIALFFDGNRRMAAGDAAGAEASFRDALALAPHLAEALANLALLREQAGDVVEAEASYRRAIALLPDAVQTCLNFGVFLMRRRAFPEAERLYRHALALAPDSPAAWSNLGVLLACMRREDEAEQCYRKALQLDGGYSKARFNLGVVLLRQGMFAEGWRCFEARDWYAALANHFAMPRWQGETLADKAIVIGFEGGHGDMIQFCRYTAVLKSLGAARISVVCHPGLKTLFGSLPGADEILSFSDSVPASAWDYWVPPLSLPSYCHTRLDNIPATIPYLSADPLKAAQWSQRLPASGKRVGLAWKGNPRFENDADRSLPSLTTLSALGDVPGLHFISLQKGAGEDEAERPPAGMSLLPLGPALTDFSDTAAVIANLDLVISVDTAVAHLAGALGKPCWVLLPEYWTDWRWLHERTDSPWYPRQMRLFRQARGDAWEHVIATVAASLRAWVQAPDALPPIPGNSWS